MNYQDYIFELPIYSYTEESYYQKLEEEIIGEKALNLESYKRLFPDNFQEEYEQYIFKRRCRIMESNTWRYNEIVGYIGIYFLGNQIRAEYSYTTAKRIVKGGKKRIGWVGKLFERSIYDPESSEEIFSSLKEEIELLKKEKNFKRRFIDTSLLYKTGKHINWIKIMKKENIFTPRKDVKI